MRDVGDVVQHDAPVRVDGVVHVLPGLGVGVGVGLGSGLGLGLKLGLGLAFGLGLGLGSGLGLGCGLGRVGVRVRVRVSEHLLGVRNIGDVVQHDAPVRVDGVVHVLPG